MEEARLRRATSTAGLLAVRFGLMPEGEVTTSRRGAAWVRACLQAQSHPNLRNQVRSLVSALEKWGVSDDDLEAVVREALMMSV